MKRWHDQKSSLFPEMSENPWSSWPRGVTVSTGEANTSGFTTLEMCAGAGGQALGLESAGIRHVGLIEIDKNACATLRLNRPDWNVIEQDLHQFDGSAFRGVDLVSGGLRCPP